MVDQVLKLSLNVVAGNGARLHSSPSNQGSEEGHLIVTTYGDSRYNVSRNRDEIQGEIRKEEEEESQKGKEGLSQKKTNRGSASHFNILLFTALIHLRKSTYFLSIQASQEIQHFDKTQVEKSLVKKPKILEQNSTI